MDFIESLKALANSEDILQVSGDVSELRSKFEDYVLEEERKFQVSQLEAQENGDPIPELETDFGKEEFYTIYKEYQEKRKTLQAEKKEIENKNLAKKKGLIARLRDVIQNEENIGGAFAAFKEIQEQWKEIGDIPRSVRNDIQTEYSKLLEDFFYNISIYKELKDHDLKRNHQLKLEVINQLKALSKTEKIKEVENQLRLLQNDWEEIGPVLNEEWEKLKDSYWTEVRSIYERINRHYDDRKKEMSDRIEEKKKLIEKTKDLISQVVGSEEVKIWNKMTNELQTIQEEWKKIGFGARKENDEVWKLFREQCDVFFAHKKEFFAGIHDQYDAIAEKKRALIDKANELRSSTDWKGTTDQIKRLQSDWKKLGHAGVKHEQKLWKAFRGACDEFFNNRSNHFNEQDKAFETNLEAKRAIIKEIKDYKASEDPKKVANDLKEFSSRFNVIGMVPRKDKDTVYKEFKSVLDNHYSNLKIEGQEKDAILFQAKIDTVVSSPDSYRLLSGMKNDIRKQIDKEMKEINLLENNLGFFANSKGADSLKKDVEKKIEIARTKIDKLKKQLKMIPNE